MHFILQDKDSELFPKDEDGKHLFEVIDHIDTWREMEKCVELGLVRSIGLSNFNSRQIQHIMDNSKIKPVVNQVSDDSLLLSNYLECYLLSPATINS